MDKIAKTDTAAYFSPRSRVNEGYARIFDGSSVNMVYLENDDESFQHYFNYAYFPLDWHKQYNFEEIDQLLEKFEACLYKNMVHTNFVSIQNKIVEYLSKKDHLTDDEKIRYFDSFYSPPPFFKTS